MEDGILNYFCIGKNEQGKKRVKSITFKCKSLLSPSFTSSINRKFVPRVSGNEDDNDDDRITMKIMTPKTTMMMLMVTIDKIKFP